MNHLLCIVWSRPYRLACRPRAVRVSLPVHCLLYVGQDASRSQQPRTAVNRSAHPCAPLYGTFSLVATRALDDGLEPTHTAATRMQQPERQPPHGDRAPPQAGADRQRQQCAALLHRPASSSRRRVARMIAEDWTAATAATAAKTPMVTSATTPSAAPGAEVCCSGCAALRAEPCRGCCLHGRLHPPPRVLHPQLDLRIHLGPSKLGVGTASPVEDVTDVRASCPQQLTATRLASSVPHHRRSDAGEASPAAAKMTAVAAAAATSVAVEADEAAAAKGVAAVEVPTAKNSAAAGAAASSSQCQPYPAIPHHTFC
eukprot:scaffold13551_cov142-Isochrysis_galbana.AAC.3